MASIASTHVGAEVPAMGFVRGAPQALLRLEGLAAFALAAWMFSRLGGGWMLFLVLFLVPDLSMAGYFAGRRFGAAAYNTAHTYAGPAALIAAGLAVSQPLILQLAMIWAAHVGLDRALGYGLKYATAFGDTHLGRVGRSGA